MLCSKRQLYLFHSKQDHLQVVYVRHIELKSRLFDVSKNLKISGPFMGGMPEKHVLSKKNIKRQQTEAE